MIINREAVRTAWEGLVGFYQTSNPSYEPLVQSLLVTRSGRRVNDAHALLNDDENVDQSIKNFSKFIYEDWNVATLYSLGEKTTEANVNYEYINSTPSAGNAVSDPLYWQEIDEFSDYLSKQYRAGVDMVLDDWINDKKIRYIIKSIYDQVLLFSGSANYDNLQSNGTDFVGLMFRMKVGERSLAVILNKIGTHFDGSFVGLDLYLYHSSRQEPIAQTTIDSVSKNMRWQTMTGDEWTLRYVDETLQAGGEYYLGYHQADLEALGGKALDIGMDWRGGCGSCGDNNYFEQYSNYIDVQGVTIPATQFDGTALTADNVGWVIGENYGLNINMSAKCDIGEFCIQREELFADALTNAVGMKLMQAMAYSIRGGNQVANHVSEMAKKELFVNDGITGTLADRYHASIKALSFDLSDLGEGCFPCDEGDPEIIGTVTLS